MTRDPFSVLGVDETADDAEIRRRYLALVRDHPPDRAPERFRDYRAAYEALLNERTRLETTLLRTNEAALTRLSLAALAAPPVPARASRRTLAALLAEGVMHAVINRQPPEGDTG